MRRRVHVELRGSTEARANAHRTWIINQLAGKTLHTQDVAPTSLNEGGWVACAQVRFENPLDAETVYAQATTKLTADANVAPGSLVEWHDCSHDETAVQPCVIGARTVK